MSPTWPRASVTGHRALTAAQLAWLRPGLDRVLAKLRDEHGATDAATGMARGADLEFGWSALFAGMALHAHVPYPQQHRGWRQADRDAYQRLLERCATRTVYGTRYDVGLLFKRNDGLLDFAAEHGGVVVAVWDGWRTGGTYETLRKAVTRDLPVIHMDPAVQSTHAPGCTCVQRLRRSA